MIEADVVELLLPRGDARTREHARRLVTFARLVAGDLGTPRAGSTDADLERAREEFGRAEKRERESALETLLVALLEPVLGPESFVTLPEAEGDWQSAWTLLERLRATDPAVPEVPRPGESVASLGARLLGWARAADGSLGPDEQGETGAPTRAANLWDVWAARLAAATGSGEEAERAWRAIVTEREAGWRVRGEGILGWAQSLLDRGAVRAAADLLDEHLGEVACDDRATRLLAWCRALLGDAETARELVRDVAPSTHLPTALLEVRRVRRDTRVVFASGRAPVSRAEGAQARSIPRPIEGRRDVGAVFFAVAAVGPDGAALPVALEVAPGLRETAPEAWRRRDGALRRRGEPEHELMRTAEPILSWREGDRRLRGALCDGSRALALVPILRGEASATPEGAHGCEVLGWLHIECEHDLLPSRARLEAAARAWRGRALDALADAAEGERGEGGRSSAPAPGGAGPRSIESDAADPRAELVRRWFEGSGRRWNSRRWWLYDVRGAAVECVGSGGGALSDWASEPGGARGLQRARLAAGSVVFAEPSPALSVHAGAGSGRVVPLELGSRVWGLVAVESTRRGDLAGTDGDEIEAGLRALAVAFREAQFRAWCRSEFGHDVLLRVDTVAAATRGEMFALARSNAVLVLSGPPGVGKEVLARWLHFEGEREHWVHHVCGALDPAEEEERLFGRGGVPADATVVLDGYERWPLRLQSALARHLDGGRDGARNRARERARNSSSNRGAAAARPSPKGVAEGRWLLLSRHAPAECAERGLLASDLAARLERSHLALLPLRRRRAWIPELFDLLLRRFAEAERCVVPTLGDDARALLWRQAWEGNVRELETLAYRLVVECAGRALERGEPPADAIVDAARVGELLERLGLPALPRLPSRRPDAEDVRAALESTRRRTGALNKRRAAFYLGWDPDTLVARMTDLDLVSLFA